MPPLWALGWHQSRWGYKTLDDLKNVVKNYDDNRLPLDTLWSDIDYLNNYRDFEVDQTRFGGLADFVNNDLHKNHRRWVPILDAGVAYRNGSDYEAFNDLQTNKLYMKIG